MLRFAADENFNGDISLCAAGGGDDTLQRGLSSIQFGTGRPHGRGNTPLCALFPSLFPLRGVKSSVSRASRIGFAALRGHDDAGVPSGPGSPYNPLRLWFMALPVGARPGPYYVVSAVGAGCMSACGYAERSL